MDGSPGATVASRLSPVIWSSSGSCLWSGLARRISTSTSLPAGGTAFLALEDKGGPINVVLRPEVYEACRGALHAI